MKKNYLFVCFLLLFCFSCTGRIAAKNSAIELVTGTALGGKVTFLLPKDFSPMAKEMIDIKYLSARKPTEVFSNKRGTVVLSFNHTNSPMMKSQVNAAHTSTSKALHNMYPSANWFRDETIVKDTHNFIVLEFITPAIDTKMHNIMYITSVDNRGLIVNFSSTVGLSEEWIPIGKKIMESLKFTTITRENSKLKNLISEQPEGIDRFYYYKNKGKQAARQNGYREALKYFLKAEEIEGDNIELLGLIGAVFKRLSMYDDAIQYFKKVLLLNPEEYRAYYDIASIYRDRGKFSEAKVFYQKVLGLKYSDKGSILNLAEISFKTNQYNDTLKYISLFTEIIDKEGTQLLTDEERIKIRKTRERFDHYRSIIVNKLKSKNEISEEKRSTHGKDDLLF